MKKIYLGGKHKDKYVLVDDDLFEELSKYKWQYNKGYVEGKQTVNKKRKQILMHRLIWTLKYNEIPIGYKIDHIDRNPLNNQIDNLRLATNQENCCNQGKRKNNTSGYKGISKIIERDKRNKNIYIYKKWLAKITYKGKSYVKKFPYTDEGFEQAKAWRIMKEKELFGEFAP